MAKETILVVDDDLDLREIISIYLKDEGYNVLTAKNGSQALEAALSHRPELIILDLMLPDLDGIEVCQELRKDLSAPIIFLSCKDSPQDKSVGLIAGGDDYLGKPFDSMELIARVKAHLRRSRILARDKPEAKLLSFPGLTIDLDRYSAELNCEEIDLAPKEFELLVLLAQNPNKVIKSEDLYQKIWGLKSFGDYSTLMVHISRLRKKIKNNRQKKFFIKTVKGVGYKFCVEST